MIYFIKPNGTNVVKIGQSNTPYKRLIGLQTGSYKKLKLLKLIKNPDNLAEQLIHTHFAAYKTSSDNEWYHLKLELISFITLLSEPKIYTVNEIKDVLGNLPLSTNSIDKYRKYTTKDRAKRRESKEPFNVNFQKLIRQNKDKLIENGIKWSTVRSWAYGQRMPDIKSALKIADILDMPLAEVPYREVTFNRP